MKKLIVGFSKPKGKFKPISAIIRKIQKSEFSHVYFQIKNEKMRNDFYYHASGSSVNFMGTDLFFKKNITVKVFEFEINEETFYNFLDSAIDKVGLSYSILQLIGILLARIFKLQHNPFGKSGFICSELVMQILKEVRGLEIKKDSNLIDLNDVFNLLNNEIRQL